MNSNTQQAANEQRQTLLKTGTPEQFDMDGFANTYWNPWGNIVVIARYNPNPEVMSWLVDHITAADVGTSDTLGFTDEWQAAWAYVWYRMSLAVLKPDAVCIPEKIKVLVSIAVARSAFTTGEPSAVWSAFEQGPLFAAIVRVACSLDIVHIPSFHAYTIDAMVAHGYGVNNIGSYDSRLLQATWFHGASQTMASIFDRHSSHSRHGSNISFDDWPGFSRTAFTWRDTRGNGIIWWLKPQMYLGTLKTLVDRGIGVQRIRLLAWCSSHWCAVTWKLHGRVDDGLVVSPVIPIPSDTQSTQSTQSSDVETPQTCASRVVNRCDANVPNDICAAERATWPAWSRLFNEQKSLDYSGSNSGVSRSLMPRTFQLVMSGCREGEYDGWKTMVDYMHTVGTVCGVEGWSSDEILHEVTRPYVPFMSWVGSVFRDKTFQLLYKTAMESTLGSSTLLHSIGVPITYQIT